MPVIVSGKDHLFDAVLQVVQPGSRASFRRRVIDAMRTIVDAPAAFFCFGTQDARAYADSLRVDGQGVRALADAPGLKLSTAFGFELRSVVETERRAYLAEELYGPGDRDALPYFASHSKPYGYGSAILLFLHEGGVLFGLAGLERRTDDAPFEAEDCARLERLAPFIIASARAQMHYDELTREAAALRALGGKIGTLFVVDRDRRAVVWGANRERGLDWEQEVLPFSDAIVNAAESSLSAKTRGDALPTPPRLPMGTLAAVAKIEGDPVFGAARCAVVRLDSSERTTAAMEGLSKREREIARLLVAGYSGVNVAAIAGVSENTVRTYVRRLYAKLGVMSRADLVRKLVAPDPRSAQPPSQLAPPPDSSLLQGDDTLD